MKKLCTVFLMVCCVLATHAQSDARPFRAYLFNKEYSIFLRINLHDQDITVPGQEVYGQLPGYLGKDRYSFCWPVVSAELDGNKATITLVNDYGSEDLTATLTQENDTTYMLRQTDGSALKMPEKGKWQKLPKTIVFKRKPHQRR